MIDSNFSRVTRPFQPDTLKNLLTRVTERLRALAALSVWRSVGARGIDFVVVNLAAFLWAASRRPVK